MADHIRTTPLRLRQSEHRTILFVGDLIMSGVSIFLAIYAWVAYNRYILITVQNIKPKRVPNFVDVPPWFYLLPVIWLLLMVELYEPHVVGSFRRTLRGIAITFFVGILAYAVIFIFIKDPTSLPRFGVGAFLLIASLLTLSWRALYIRIYRRTGQLRRVLIIGAGFAGETLARVYREANIRSFSIVGFIDDDPKKIHKSIYEFSVLGNSSHLLRIIDAFRVSDLVIAISGEVRGETFQAILDAQESGIDVTRMPILYEEMTGRVPIHHLESDWIIRSFVDEVRVSGFYELAKRVLDLIGSLLGIILFAIVFPFIALATIIDSGFPIFYSQERLGRGGKHFKIYKFRTMRRDAESDGEAKLAAENDPRVTRVGNFLRRTRLDELPQFWTVLMGEMSLVGPRAERPELVDAFQKQIPFYRARLLVKPGLTGWAQINYGYFASVTEMEVKLEYDLYYIKHRTLPMDFQIALRTIGTVLRRSGR